MPVQSFRAMATPDGFPPPNPHIGEGQGGGVDKERFEGRIQAGASRQSNLTRSSNEAAA